MTENQEVNEVELKQEGLVLKQAGRHWLVSTHTTY